MLLLSCALLPEARVAREPGRTSRQRSHALVTRALACVTQPCQRVSGNTLRRDISALSALFRPYRR